MRNKFPIYRQAEFKDCGPACLKMIGEFYGRELSLSYLQQLCETNRQGSNLSSLSSAAEKLGFRALGVKLNYVELVDQAPLPCIIHWRNTHFVVVFDTSKSKVKIADPAFGILSYDKASFIKSWIGNNASDTEKDGITLLLETTPRFLDPLPDESPNGPSKKISFWALYGQYITKYKNLFVQLILGLILGSLFQLCFPFLTQAVVDVAIKKNNLSFLYLILLGQLMLFLGRTVVDIVRGWILLHLSTRINISLISNFFIKLMNLPIGFYDSRMTGDIYQRINDHKRIEHLLTNNSLNAVFSFVNLLIFAIVLTYYNISVAAIFISGTILNVLWFSFFLKKRREIDYRNFSELANEQSKVLELISGMQEIKLHNSEQKKRWEWEFIQAKLFKISKKGLAIEQAQNIGSSVISQLISICITILSAYLVLKSQITLGMMLAIQYIVGQLNNPVLQLLDFARSVQDARISLERVKEIESKPNEEDVNRMPTDSAHLLNQSIYIENLSFRYPGSIEPVINNISFTVPQNKITAIVGASGSGKTTLMKLLLKFYDNYQGSISIGDMDMAAVSHKSWRAVTGVVMQEGYIFNDSIANNIAVGATEISIQRLKKAAEMSNITDFVLSLPAGFNTMIGNEGVNISTGQKQRILISRAIYKSPYFLFFDEATSALDAENEKIIVQNLNRFFSSRTALVIAHRLSTVKHADQIIVLDQGKIAESGSHTELIERKGKYFELVKNQLELELMNAND